LLNKIDLLRLEVATYQFDLILLSETLPSLDIDDAQLQIPGYYVLCKGRKTNRHGGVAAYVRNLLHTTVSLDTSNSIIELLNFVMHGPSNVNIHVGVASRPPGQLEALYDVLLSQLTKLSVSNHVLIVGDFNAPTIDWVNLTTHVPDYAYEGRLLELSLGRFLVQHVTQFTREVVSAQTASN